MTTPDFDGQAVLVTGATSGIGEATARMFASCGGRVMLTGRREIEGERIVEEIREAGGTAGFCRADVRVGADIERMVATTVDTYGRLDHAFNNAGIFDRMHLVHTYDDDAWDEMIAVNLTAVFRCMKHELAAMLDAAGPLPGGRVIVNNGSTVAHRGSDRASAAYVASKHAVLGLTRQAAVQYADQGIRVNAVAPGPTLTEVALPLVAEGADAVRAALSGLNPRAEFITPAQVAAAVVFLCSEAAGMINGHDLAVDGGQLAKL